MSSVHPHGDSLGDLNFQAPLTALCLSLSFTNQTLLSCTEHQQTFNWNTEMFIVQPNVFKQIHQYKQSTFDVKLNFKLSACETLLDP